MSALLGRLRERGSRLGADDGDALISKLMDVCETRVVPELKCHHAECGGLPWRARYSWRLASNGRHLVVLCLPRVHRQGPLVCAWWASDFRRESIDQIAIDVLSRAQKAPLRGKWCYEGRVPKYKLW